MDTKNLYNPDSDDEELLNINLKKIVLSLWTRKVLILKVFSCVLLFFILLTFVSEKKWMVNADLYIKQSNSSNYAEINPFAIEESLNKKLSVELSNPLNDEIELMQSPLIIDKVILENNLKFKKLFGVIPTKKTGEYLTTEKFLKSKKLKVEIKKGTNVVSISYKCKDKDVAYGVVTSIIKNYIELHKELNSEKSKSDKRIIETEYQKAKEDLNKKVNIADGLPTQTMSGTGQLAAMSAFSRSAQSAMATLKGQYREGEKARVEINEDVSKLNQLAQRLEWARLVEEMSDISKVLVIKEPKPLKDWEYSSPKLFNNILLGIIYGSVFSLFALMCAEKFDKKLAYSMLGDDIIYNAGKDVFALRKTLLSNNDKQIAAIEFNEIPASNINELQKYKNINFVHADLTEEFMTVVNHAESAILFGSIGKTDSELYKSVKEILTEKNKQILKEVLV